MNTTFKKSNLVIIEYKVFNSEKRKETRSKYKFNR